MFDIFIDLKVISKVELSMRIRRMFG